MTDTDFEAAVSTAGEARYLRLVQAAGGFPRAYPNEAARSAALAEIAARETHRDNRFPALPAPPRRSQPALLAAPTSTHREEASMPEPQIDDRRLRRVKAITQVARLKPAPVPPPPQISWLPLTQLVVDEAYQRSLSASGIALIRRLVNGWNWNMFKPLSVAAAGGGLYEVLDGQHTAIAAATHGSIVSLPCLVLTANTTEDRAAAFVGINHDRVSLTPHALWRGRVAAGDASANAVREALEQSGATLVPTFSASEIPAAGSLSCVGTLLSIEKTWGGEMLASVLKIAVDANLAPIPAAVLRALCEIYAVDGRPPGKARVTQALRDLGGAALLEKARERRRDGRASTQGDAVLQLILHQVEGSPA